MAETLTRSCDAVDTLSCAPALRDLTAAYAQKQNITDVIRPYCILHTKSDVFSVQDIAIGVKIVA